MMSAAETKSANYKLDSMVSRSHIVGVGIVSSLLDPVWE